MEWTQVDIYTTTAGIEPVGAVLMELCPGGYTVQDAGDFAQFLEGKVGHWDYIDEELLKLSTAETTLTVYLAQNEQGVQQLASLREALVRLRSLDDGCEWGRLECALSGVQEEDWETAWKKYYSSFKLGGGLVICPSWEEYNPLSGETVVSMDPGMAFGTGTHDSTRMCLTLLERHLPENAGVLDLGCGSGILAVSALLLGAREAMLVDIDQVAVRVARENAERNGVLSRCAFHQGSLAGAVQGPYALIFANIVADVILQFLPDVDRLLAKDGVFITSGIIDTRETDVVRGLTAASLTIVERVESGGWVAFCCKRSVH